MSEKADKQDKNAPVSENKPDKDKNYKGIIPKELIKGRPRAYKTVEAMADKIAEYLEERQNMVIDHVVAKDKDGCSEVVDIVGQGAMSIGSLCDFLGISDETFDNYGTDEKYKKFHALVAWAKQKICGYHEDTAATSGKNKADFILINRFRKAFSKDAATPNVNFPPKVLVEYVGKVENDASESSNT